MAFKFLRAFYAPEARMEANGVHVLLTCLVMLSMMDVLSSSPHPKPIVNGKAVRNRSEERRVGKEC